MPRRRACEQQADVLGDLAAPFAPIELDVGQAIAAVWALYESTFKDACVMDWTQEQATLELTARLQVISLGRQKRVHDW